MGPTNKTLSLSPQVEDPGFREVTFDEVKQVYHEQAAALIEGGADFILVETVFDTLNCKAAIMAVRELERDLGREVPLMIRSEEHTSELQSLMRNTYAVFC